MGILDNFEKGLERVVNGAFAKTFKSGLQPLEVTAALRRELDTKAAVVSRDRILVPNRFTVRLAPGDYERMNNLGPALIDEFTQLVQQHAAALRFAQRLIAADEFIVRHASICEHDRSPRADAHLAAKR